MTPKDEKETIFTTDLLLFLSAKLKLKLAGDQKTWEIKNSFNAIEDFKS